MKNNFSKFLLATLVASGCLLASCDGNGGQGKKQTYIMEAEYIDLDDVQGAGVSSDQGGVEMIYGDGTNEQKSYGWSNGYYVGYTYSDNLQLDFVFNADSAATATIVARLGSELGDLSLDPTTFEVQLNGVSVPYASISVGNSEMATMTFYDKTITQNASLVSGKNTISLIVRANHFKGGNSTGGPCVDCVKISTTAKLTWTDKTENPSNRGAI